MELHVLYIVQESDSALLKLSFTVQCVQKSDNITYTVMVSAQMVARMYAVFRKVTGW